MDTFTSLIFIPEGTLLNEKLALKAALRTSMRNLNKDFGPAEQLKYSQISNNFKMLSEKEQIQLLLANFLPDENDALTIFQANLAKQHRLIKGSLDFLTQVKGHLTLVALGKTKKDILLPRLKSSGIADYFEALFFADDFSEQFPDKNLLIKIIANLNLDPDSCLVIGANLNDEIQAAENANLKSLWLAPKKEKIPITPHPTLHLSRLADLLFYLNIE